MAERMGSPMAAAPYGQAAGTANLADILERVLDKGIVIAGDIQINLLDIELLTIKLRLLVASVDKAKEMGIEWWEHDPSLSSGAHGGGTVADGSRSRGSDAVPAGRGSAGALPGEPGADQDAGAGGSADRDADQSAEIERLRAEVARLRAGRDDSGEADR
jgi:hypothetical protein